MYLCALLAVLAGVRFGFPDWFAGEAEAVEAAASTAPPPVVVAVARRRPLVDDLEALGTVRANESVALRPHRADRVEAIHFSDGMDVDAGQVLVELHVTEEQAELDEALALRDERQAAFDRAQELFEQEVESEGRATAARAQLDAAQARVARLRSAIDDHTVVAPFAGTLGLRQVSVGAYVEPSTVITTLDDLSVVKVDFTVPETWLEHVATGMAVRARSAAWEGIEFDGEIKAIDTRVDETARAARVRALLTNGERRLKPGMLLSLTLEQSGAEVLQVPEEAIKSERARHYVRRVQDGVAHKVEVVLGRRTEGFVEVVEGLADGDEVVVQGLERVRDGHPVRAVADPDAVADPAAVPGAGEGR